MADHTIIVDVPNYPPEYHEAMRRLINFRDAMRARGFQRSTFALIWRHYPGGFWRFKDEETLVMGWKE